MIGTYLGCRGVFHIVTLSRAVNAAGGKASSAARCAPRVTGRKPRWQSAQHRLAMDHANDKSVLGDFNNAAFDYYDVHSRHHDPRLMSWS
jgi:hypothetical protein